MLLALCISFPFSFFFNQHQSVPDLTSNPECGLLGSYRFLFVFWNTFCCLVYKENRNLEWLNLVNITRPEREMPLAELMMKGPKSWLSEPPPACLVDSHCLFCASLFLSRRLSIHTGSTPILFSQLVSRLCWCFIKVLFWHHPLQAPHPHAQGTPVPSGTAWIGSLLLPLFLTLFLENEWLHSPKGSITESR